MKSYFVLFLVFFLSVPILLGEAVIREFNVEPGFNKVQIIWKVTVETNVKGYKILRGFDSNRLYDLDFVEANSSAIPPDGKLYTYSDTGIFKNQGRTFYYRIQVIDTQGKVTTETSTKSVSPKISAVRHTWGSIKAIFR